MNAKIIQTVPKGGASIVTLEAFGDRSKLKIGKWMELREPRRTPGQNRYLYGMARWAVEEGGAKQLGHYSPEALIANWKASVGLEHTSDLDIVEFSEAADQFGLFLVEFLGLDMSPYYAMIESKRQD